jgi:hypothetical protein
MQAPARSRRGGLTTRNAKCAAPKSYPHQFSLKNAWEMSESQRLLISAVEFVTLVLIFGLFGPLLKILYGLVAKTIGPFLLANRVYIADGTS